VAAHDASAASVQLHLALAGASRYWVRGRIHRELGKVDDLSGDRPAALREYDTACELCRADHDSDCVASVRALTKTAYR
jgi:hypothetical protein